MDLNTLLAQCVLGGDKAGVEKIIALSLDTHKTLQLVRETKQYDLLKILRPILNIDLSAEEIIQAMYADVLQEGNQEKMLLLQEIYEYDIEDVSFLCGQNDYNTDLLTAGFDLYSYVRGILSVDDLDRFLLAREKYQSQWSGYFITENGRRKDIRESISQYFPVKIMDHFGYDRENLRWYMRNIFSFRNAQLLTHLCQKKETSQVFFDVVVPTDDQGMIEVLQWVLQEGGNFSEEIWQTLKENRPVVYAACQPDV